MAGRKSNGALQAASLQGSRDDRQHPDEVLRRDAKGGCRGGVECELADGAGAYATREPNAGDRSHPTRVRTGTAAAAPREEGPPCFLNRNPPYRTFRSGRDGGKGRDRGGASHARSRHFLSARPDGDPWSEVWAASGAPSAKATAAARKTIALPRRVIGAADADLFRKAFGIKHLRELSLSAP